MTAIVVAVDKLAVDDVGSEDAPHRASHCVSLSWSHTLN